MAGVSPLHRRALFSQQWYTAEGTVEGTTQLQTVECGYHIDPGRYNDNNPHLFVYSTPDTYGTGSFNNDNGLFKPKPAGSSAILGGQPPAASTNSGIHWLYDSGSRKCLPPGRAEDSRCAASLAVFCFPSALTNVDR